MKFLKDKSVRLFVILTGFFLTNVFIAEFIGIKIFSLEETLGLSKFQFSFFGKDDLSFDLTAGVLLWPFVFVLTDVVNEYFGRRGVRMMSLLAVAMIIYAFIMFYLGIKLVPASWWPETQAVDGIPDMNSAFAAVFGQGLWIIGGSLVAFLVGQVL
ncbi:MAG: VUT family protein, partial [Chitinophagales bacterium]|nr:VUT family protein [Chitinophagales bacterium]